MAPLLRTEIDENVAKMKRQIPSDCPPPRIGSPGEIGEAGEDGESGDAGEDGAAGLDAMTLLLQEAQKCVICPQGPAGPIGAPGLVILIGRPNCAKYSLSKDSTVQMETKAKLGRQERMDWMVNRDPKDCQDCRELPEKQGKGDRTVT